MNSPNRRTFVSGHKSIDISVSLVHWATAPRSLLPILMLVTVLMSGPLDSNDRWTVCVVNIFELLVNGFRAHSEENRPVGVEEMRLRRLEVGDKLEAQCLWSKRSLKLIPMINSKNCLRIGISKLNLRVFGH